MRSLLCFSAVFLFALIFQNPIANASIVTESFSGSGALLSSMAPDTNGNGNPNYIDHTGNSFTFVATDVSGCAEISFDVTVSVGGGPVHFDTRGFGDSGSTNDAFQTTPAVETMQFSISAPTVTLAAAAPAGSSIVSSSVVASFTSFDVVNNGASSPGVDWSASNVGGVIGGGTATSTGTTSGVILAVPVTSGATQIDLTASAAWMWINNAQYTYSGDVVIDKPEAIPEPGSLALMLVGLGLFSTRRRR